MNNTILNQTVIPSVRDLKHLDLALKSPSPFILLSEAHIGNLQLLTKRCHAVNKKVLVHLDLIGGVSKDQIGLKMLRDLYKIDGVISPNANLLKRVKDLGLISIQRLFLLDSRSLESGLKSMEERHLDALELLPGPFSLYVIEKVRKTTSLPLLAGGFISEDRMVKKLFEGGIKGITTSEKHLWKTK